MYIINTVNIQTTKNYIIIIDVYFVYKTDMNLLNQESKPCHKTDVKLDFGKCMKDAIEAQIKCTIPDMTSGTPMAPNGKLTHPVCSSPEEFRNYTELYSTVAHLSEGDIFREFGCMPKCKESLIELNAFTMYTVFIVFSLLTIILLIFLFFCWNII